AVPRPAARGRPRDAAAAAPRPVRRRAAGVGTGPGVPVPLLDVGGAAPGAGVLGTPGDRVAHRAARTVRVGSSGAVGRGGQRRLPGWSCGIICCAPGLMQASLSVTVPG